MRPTHRRICWPDPSDECLQGECAYCNQSPYLALTEIETCLATDAQWGAWRAGKAADFNGAQVRSGR